MRVMFINPPYLEGFSRGQRSPQVSLAGSMYYPYWLAYAAGLLDKRGFTISLIDAPAGGISKERALKEIRDFNPVLIVLDTSTPSIISDLEFANEIKYKFVNVSLGLVGTHPSVEAEKILLDNQQIDWIARREFDYTILELAESIRDKQRLTGIKGLSYSEGSQIIHNPERDYIENLDSLPFVSQVYKKYLNIKDYYFVPALYPMVMIITGRGCPFRCFFCVWPQVMHGYRYRLRSPESVVDEMLFIKKEIPQIREIVFEDDTFAADIDRVDKICNLIIKYKIDIPWFANLRVDINFDTLKLMKIAGLHSCAVGYETVSQEMLNIMKKGIKVEQSLRFAKEAKRLGIIVHGCFMVGFPGETKETMKRTFKFAKILKCDSAQFYPIFLYPGTQAYEWAKKMNYITTYDYSNWLGSGGRYNCIYSFPELTGKEMVEFCNQAYKKYHLPPNYLLRKSIQCIFNSKERNRTLRYGLKYLRKRH